MSDKKPIALSLCDRTGNILKPWAASGEYTCIAVDIHRMDGYRSIHFDFAGIDYVGADVLRYLPPRGEYAFACAFPPCTHLAASGARWFQDKGLAALADSLEIVDQCRKILEWTGAPYFLENPVSTLATYWRKPDHTFHPHEYGGYEGGQEDAYTKLTCLWTGNGFKMPPKLPIEPAQGSKMHLLPDSAGRDERRSVTPMGFAQAVYEANKIRSES